MPRKPTRGETTRLNIQIESDLMDQVEDVRFAKRFKTRTEAIEALIRVGVRHSNDIMQQQKTKTQKKQNS